MRGQYRPECDSPACQTISRSFASTPCDAIKGLTKDGRVAGGRYDGLRLVSVGNEKVYNWPGRSCPRNGVGCQGHVDVKKAAKELGHAPRDSKVVFMKQNHRVEAWNPLDVTLLLSTHDTAAVQSLLERKSNVNYRDRKGTTPLDNALSPPVMPTVKLLLEARADPRRSLIPAVFHGSLEATEYVLAARADLLARREGLEKQDTPLHMAVQKKHLGIVRALLRAAKEHKQMIEVLQAKDQFGLEPIAWVNDELIGHALVEAGRQNYDETWTVPLSTEGTYGHPTERVRIEAKREFRHITKRNYEERLKKWLETHRVELAQTKRDYDERHKKWLETHREELEHMREKDVELRAE
eukprot:GEMP01043623.1.p1 GENE.GEMP01043623.1~~GEMP01043623.1.p1  ORF type:complete len:353 (+),score=88.83 GEMP01043623.1:122-1180(+)